MSKKVSVEEVAKAVETIAAGLSELAVLLRDMDSIPMNPPSENEEEEKSLKPSKSVSVDEAKEPEKDGGTYSREDLASMKYNDLKKLGSSLGVKCTGNRDEITEKILNALASGDEKEDSKSDNVVPMPTATKSVSKKSSTKKEEPAPEPEEEDGGVSEDDLQLARELIEDNGIEAVIEELKNAGVKVPVRDRKKKDVIAKMLAEAIASGDIELEEDEDEDGDVDSPASVGDSELTPESYFSQYDPDGYNEPDSMSEKRAQGVISKTEEIIDAITIDELDVETISAELEDIMTEEDSELLGKDASEEDIIAFYIELMKRFIDDEGNDKELSDCYEVNGDPFCCGHPLEYVKKTGKYVCPVCGETYEE